VTIAGTPLVQLGEAVAILFLLDDFVESAAFRMTPDGDPAFVADVHREVKGALMRVGRGTSSWLLWSGLRLTSLLGRASPVVATTDVAAFGCFLLTNGAVPPLPTRGPRCPNAAGATFPPWPEPCGSARAGR
jgi:L-fucose mutarotase/ribose pyranase (RbsD/FucU family)